MIKRLGVSSGWFKVDDVVVVVVVVVVVDVDVVIADDIFLVEGVGIKGRIALTIDFKISSFFVSSSIWDILISQFAIILIPFVVSFSCNLSCIQFDFLL